jgi:two-component system sensor histidine kinase TctE
MAGTDPEETAADLHQFAETVAHELRTPLAAVAGEVELALRRDRSPAEYRDALRRIAAGISALVDITGDLTLLGAPPDAGGRIPASASLATVLAALSGRYAGHTSVNLSADDRDARLRGEERRIARAITLVVEHAIRHRRASALVFARAQATDDGGARVAIDAGPAGFWPNAWAYLQASAGAPGPLRLRAARRIVEDSGGTLRVRSVAGTEMVQIELQPSR